MEEDGAFHLLSRDQCEHNQTLDISNLERLVGLLRSSPPATSAPYLSAVPSLTQPHAENRSNPFWEVPTRSSSRIIAREVEHHSCVLSVRPEASEFSIRF